MGQGHQGSIKGRKGKEMTPIQIICENLHKFWQCDRFLRQISSDPQIFGCEYCAEGVICELFRLHAPEAKEIDACWGGLNGKPHDDGGGCFLWTKDGVRQIASQHMPQPVVDWIDRHHGQGTGENLKYALAHFNDSGWTFEQLAILLRVKFGQDVFEQIHANYSKAGL